MVPNLWPQKITWFYSKFIGKSFPNTLRKSVFAATVNFLWQERNHRIVKGIQRSPFSLIDQIKFKVRIKATQSEV